MAIDYSGVARTLLLTLKDLSGRGIAFSVENVARELAAQDQLAAHFDREGASEDTHSSQERTYHRLYQEETERATETRELLSRALLTIMRLVDSSNQTGLAEAMILLRSAVTEEMDLKKVEHSLGRVKNEIIQIEMNRTGGGKPAGKPETSPFAGVRNAYLELISELDLELDDEYRERVTMLRQKIGQAQGWDDFFALRQDVENLVRQYAGQLFDERRKATDFIAQVAARLAELEQYLTASLTCWQKNQANSEEFTERMDGEIHQTAQCVQDADQLEALKKMVMAKLSAISEVVREKNRRDEALAEEAASELTGANQRFGGLHDEIKKVQDENRFLIQKLKHDALTGAFNRFAYEEYLANELDRFRRYQRPCALILFDLDFFKEVNDNFGHAIGDKCLKEVVAGIGPVLRKNDLLARYGGDEFMILLPETGARQATDVAEKIRRTIAATDFKVRGRKVPLTITCGVTEIRESDIDGETVFTRVDKALYQAKKAGRNRVCLL
jgi:diguanylate cyclase (GGDEF)-like protein